jgi:REP element-mobilizing transposase RayT
VARGKPAFLNEEIDAAFKHLIRDIARRKGWALIELETMPTHVHLLLEKAPWDDLRTIVGISRDSRPTSCCGASIGCAATSTPMASGIRASTTHATQRARWLTSAPTSAISGLSAAWQTSRTCRLAREIDPFPATVKGE